MCNSLPMTTLAYFNREKTVITQSDADKHGLEAALILGWMSHSIFHLISSQTSSQDMLTWKENVCYGLEKFHTYIYGRNSTIHNDHMPLEMIQHKPIPAAPPRLQRMWLQLQTFHYTMQYKMGREIILAERLSRFPSRKGNQPIT